MKIIQNCWSAIEAYNCQYGAHIFDGANVKIYVNHWLDVDNDLAGYFTRKNQEGFVGHCLLVFCGLKQFDFKVTTYSKQDGETVWDAPMTFSYSGTSTEKITEFYCEGSLHGFPSSVSIRVEAERFELHILNKDEPVREG